MQDHTRLFNGKIQSSVVYPAVFPISPREAVVNLGCGVAPQAVVYRGRFARMVGVDLDAERLDASRSLLAAHGVSGYETHLAPVEETGLPSASFDKALCIDIIEHLTDPEALLDEAFRLLKPGGRMLVTVPAMHDVYTKLFRRCGRILGKRTRPLPHGHLDAHNTDIPLQRWLDLFHNSRFEIVRTRGSTLFPPLHLYGVPRFWFTIKPIHAVDDLLCRAPFLKRFAQTYLLVLEKPREFAPAPVAMPMGQVASA